MKLKTMLDTPPWEWPFTGMKLTIEVDREVDGRWIAEIPELNVLRYGDSKESAINRAQTAVNEFVLDRIAHGELPADSVNTSFDIAA